MTTDQKFALIISGLGLLFIVISAMLGVGIRALIKFTRAEDKIAEVAEDVKQLVDAKERVHLALWQEMKDDRAATDKRLRWLEENLWKNP